MADPTPLSKPFEKIGLEDVLDEKLEATGIVGVDCDAAEAKLPKDS